MDHHSSLSGSTLADDSSSSSSVYSSQCENAENEYVRKEYEIHTRPATRGASSSYTPSFMSQHATQSTERITLPTYTAATAASIDRKRVGRKSVHPSRRLQVKIPHQLSTDIPSAQPKSGVLLVLIAGKLHPATCSYIETLLWRQDFSSIYLAAHVAQELAIKQLKLDIYALLGSMDRQCSVVTETINMWNETVTEEVVLHAEKDGSSIQSVICCPEYDTVPTCDLDILSLDGSQLQHSWEQSVAFVHASIRATKSHLLSSCQPESRQRRGAFPKPFSGPFFLVTDSTSKDIASYVTKSACDALVHQLGEATKARGLTVAFADTVLTPVSRPSKLDPDEQINMQSTLHSGVRHEQPYTPAESPTKLWNMWAMCNEVGYADA